MTHSEIRARLTEIYNRAWENWNASKQYGEPEDYIPPDERDEYFRLELELEKMEDAAIQEAKRKRWPI